MQELRQKAEEAEEDRQQLLEQQPGADQGAGQDADMADALGNMTITKEASPDAAGPSGAGLGPNGGAGAAAGAEDPGSAHDASSMGDHHGVEDQQDTEPRAMTTAGQRANQVLPACLLLLESCIDILADEVSRQDDVASGHQPPQPPCLSDRACHQLLASISRTVDVMLQFLEAAAEKMQGAGSEGDGSGEDVNNMRSPLPCRCWLSVPVNMASLHGYRAPC